MNIFEGSFAVAVFIIIALPGLIYAAVRKWARGEGPEDRDFGRSIARGAVFAVGLTTIYVLACGESLESGIVSGTDADTLAIGDPRGLARNVLFLYIILPFLVSLALNYRHLTWQAYGQSRRLRYLRSRHGYSDTPTAWDHAIKRQQSSWVKVRKPNGVWAGGWFTKGSFASSYPESRGLYIDQQYLMSDEGDFLRPIPQSSIFLTVSDDDIVIWVGEDTP
ncbi:DUF6338 family protein [Nakamurella sp.]|uniref:DUF6338 family protein n=1 Tax=Nakamurella sp. TaxID=1869182 RepID=UPI003B3B6B6B